MWKILRQTGIAPPHVAGAQVILTVKRADTRSMSANKAFEITFKVVVLCQTGHVSVCRTTTACQRTQVRIHYAMHLLGASSLS